LYANTCKICMYAGIFAWCACGATPNLLSSNTLFYHFLKFCRGTLDTFNWNQWRFQVRLSDKLSLALTTDPPDYNPLIEHLNIEEHS
jgi:hypothetical protein